METNTNEPVKQVKNSGQWKPGQSGNPKGRPPKELCLTSLAREELAKPCPFAPNKTWAEYLVERWLGQCVAHSGYFRELIERLEGKVIQPIEAGIDTKVKWIIGKGYDNEGSRAGTETDQSESG